MYHRILLLIVLFCSPYLWAFDFGKIPPEEVSVYIQDLQTGKALVSHRADTAVNPASVMKLVTTFTALRSLGSDYSWQTEWKSDAPVKNHILEGDLYWVGSGNPVLDQNDLLDVQSQLAARGIRHIRGQLVLDRQIWSNNGSAEDFDADSAETFATPPDPHMLAYKVVWLKPERNEQGITTVTLNPPLPEVPQQYNIGLYPSAAGCPSLKSYLNARYQNGTLVAEGRIPEPCLGQEMFVNMLDSTDFAARSFINQWRANGGTINSSFRIGITPKHATTLAVNHSKPLSDVLSDMNKNSNNIIARSIFLTLGNLHSKQGDTVADARAEVRRQLAQANIDDEALVLENGSGLSRRERVSARMMGEILAQAYHSSFQKIFIDSLPIGGYDGTLKNRFKNATQSLHLKTGTLKNVRALAGYRLPQTSGEHPLAIVLIVNSEQAGNYPSEMDSLLSTWLQTAQTTVMP
ncbi:peptidase S13 [Neisseria arctica]|uniref:Peptidase S13 n=1 Tax=Neisseria arctica TaxID=1470200 RepID=A0A0J0YSJ3_9NEIS|nr:D-alanyl-D-alanine carboxypeptidase/D-alanyl-D-alanine-endopeptidase [Neisseria arctica]KLT73074.1 peptidase S13 [Neisseria arctica]UOO86801.1 D-alanyl-D-alanine carboxypeptidase/D-alanyl-D-alanine-endopeptidase [Neisseria arctica]